MIIDVSWINSQSVGQWPVTLHGNQYNTALLPSVKDIAQEL